jgi:hypothetical protein
MKAGVFMSEIERIICNVNATMEMENMPLTDDNKQMIRNCIEGVKSYEETLSTLISRYSHERAVF